MKFDGRDFSKKMYQELAGRIEVLKSKGITPKLVWISMSDDEASGIYGRLKEKAAVNVGIEFEKVVVAVGQNEELRKILLK